MRSHGRILFNAERERKMSSAHPQLGSIFHLRKMDGTDGIGVTSRCRPQSYFSSNHRKLVASSTRIIR